MGSVMHFRPGFFDFFLIFLIVNNCIDLLPMASAIIRISALTQACQPGTVPGPLHGSLMPRQSALEDPFVNLPSETPHPILIRVSLPIPILRR